MMVVVVVVVAVVAVGRTDMQGGGRGGKDRGWSGMCWSSSKQERQEGGVASLKSSTVESACREVSEKSKELQIPSPSSSQAASLQHMAFLEPSLCLLRARAGIGSSHGREKQRGAESKDKKKEKSKKRQNKKNNKQIAAARGKRKARRTRWVLAAGLRRRRGR
jgi:hypothetical protein